MKDTRVPTTKVGFQVANLSSVKALLAVDYLHRCDVLHRDLRLRRLLLTRHGYASGGFVSMGERITRRLRDAYYIHYILHMISYMYIFVIYNCIKLL